MKKRNVVGVLFGLMLILVLTLGPSMKVSAAEQVPYVNITVDNNDILSISDKSISDYTVVSDQTTWGEAGKNKWYVVNNANVSIDGRITVSGDVNLILCDGCELNAKGITVSGEGNSLTVYGQTDGTGKLTIEGVPSDNAGIGGTNGQAGSNITINGGIITVMGGRYGAGIGGGKKGAGSNITINGGCITASANDGSGGAGIGGGTNGIGSNITINGGTVTATAANSSGQGGGAGIGGGTYGNGSNITINGGIVTATSGSWGAGIGGGTKGTANNITITGGTVTASSGLKGAGIGGGGRTESVGGTATGILITGGEVKAYSVNGDGIGNGDGGSGSEFSVINRMVSAGDSEEAAISQGIKDFTENDLTGYHYVYATDVVQTEIMEYFFSVENSDGYIKNGTVILPEVSCLISDAPVSYVYVDENSGKASTLPADAGNYRIYVDVTGNEYYFENRITYKEDGITYQNGGICLGSFNIFNADEVWVNRAVDDTEGNRTVDPDTNEYRFETVRLSEILTDESCVRLITGKETVWGTSGKTAWYAKYSVSTPGNKAGQTGVVGYTGPQKKKASLTVKDTVKINGITYKITSISEGAFAGNKKLKKLTIGKNITTIGAGAFKGCKNLKEIVINSKLLKAKNLSAAAFEGLGEDVVIYVPAKKLKTYTRMFKKLGVKAELKAIK